MSAKTKAHEIPADSIYTIRMLKPRCVNKIKILAGQTVEVFANDAERFVTTDKHAAYDPPLKDQQEAILIAMAN